MQARPDDAPWDVQDTLDDPLDDGTLALAPMQFDPLCELRGTPWPNDSRSAAGYEYEIAHWR